MDDTPSLSVVIGACSPEPILRRCLESILPQAQNAEVLVAMTADAETSQRLTQQFPQVRFLTATAGTSLFSLRTLGVAAARAPAVVLTEDHCTACDGWLAGIATALRNDHALVGGPVENGLKQRIYDWALFFCEYLWVMPPMPIGPMRVALGVNVAYRRTALEQCREIWRDAFYENEVHNALQRLGHTPQCAPDAFVLSHLQMPVPQALRHLYRGGYRFGRHRQSSASLPQRCLWLAAAPLVPVVLLQRMVRTLAQRQPARLGVFFVALPLVTCLIAAWSAGEAMGYLASLRTGGDSS